MEDRKRSRRYPAEPLPQCVAWTRDIRRQLGSGGYDALALAEALGSKSVSGTAKRKIATLGQFGLLARDGGRYFLSDLAVRVLSPTSGEEEKQAIREAFTSPELYSDLVNRYKPEGRMPERLANILLREFDLLEGANESAALDFLESGRFAGLLDEEGRFIEEKCQPRIEDLGEDMEEPPTPVAPVLPNAPATQDLHLQLLGDRTARLIFPLDLHPQECELIQTQIEALKRQAEIRINYGASADEE